ncbi:SRPBCC family protein [Streptomyces sp. Ru72]|uniref:SRPBCC family protein n=1 Tax=Streptomyces sp. Ru72 TaxID=2080747 RepID=UPI000CDD78E9|nr:SRPBCC family protein [Streptomyces sp. Ru72]POX43750.1 hypothetical protein C3488_35245 [Streptomyces sp. Ru72]
MTLHSAHVLINAPVDVVRQILLEPAALADWNPAFLSIEAPRTAVVGQRYPIKVKGGLSGFLEYRAISGTLIEAHWETVGFREDHSWELNAHRGGAHVRHTFEHHGVLAGVLRSAFAGVAELRLGRLAARAEARNTPAGRV